MGIIRMGGSNWSNSLRFIVIVVFATCYLIARLEVVILVGVGEK